MELKLTLLSGAGEQELAFQVNRLVCSGWVGRDEIALKAHIDELAAIGIAGPGRTPIHLNFSTYLVQTAHNVDVVSGETSGEVEYVILQQGARRFVGVGSDHTDRGFEKTSIPASKQMHPKLMAPAVWPMEEVAGHWDSLVLRSWVTAGGERMLYQEDALASILDPDSILATMPRDDGLPSDGLVLFSGTVPTKMGMVYGERFEIELEDPVLSRKLAHGYSVRILPQYT